MNFSNLFNYFLYFVPQIFKREPKLFDDFGYIGPLPPPPKQTTVYEDLNYIV